MRASGSSNRNFDHSENIVQACRYKTTCFYVQKSVEIRKSLISSALQDFECIRRRLVIMLLPSKVRFNISKYLFGCKL